MKNKEYATALMGRLRVLAPVCILLALVGCTSDDGASQQPAMGHLQLTTSVSAFVGDDGAGVTRTTMEGDAFAVGDRIKLKVICPYDPYHTNFGESTWGNTADGFWLLKWKGSEWAPIEPSDSVDMVADYRYTSSYSLFSQYHAQPTPYVYTATTWNENVFFMAPNSVGGAIRPFSQYSYIFRADQTLQKDYLKNDLMWAQTFMQTGSYDVHLSFRHMMSCLKISISGTSLSESAVVTVEGLPDIDQRELVVGDYYAHRAKNLTHRNDYFDYSYLGKCACTQEQNGTVLGVAVINDATARVDIYPLSGTDGYDAISNGKRIENDATYTAYRANTSTFCLMVPPCTLPAQAEIWIRDGEKRYRYKLDQTQFESGKLYPVNISL